MEGEILKAVLFFLSLYPWGQRYGVDRDIPDQVNGHFLQADLGSEKGTLYYLTIPQVAVIADGTKF